MMIMASRIQRWKTSVENSETKGLNCCEYKHQMTCTGCYEAAPQRNMSCVEHARKLQLAGGTLEGATMKVATQRKLQLSDAQWQLRMKFLQRPKSYIGVPYAWKYHEPRRKRQPHDIHVEIWLGDRERSIGARWKRGKLQVFASYKFVSSSYGAMQYHFKSIETWLQGVCIRQVSVMLKIRSHCPENKWASARELPRKRLIFHLLSKQGESAGEAVSTPGSRPQPQLRKEELALRLDPIMESVSDCELSSSQQVEALDLHGFSRTSSGVPKMNPERQSPVRRASQAQSLERIPLEATSLGAGGRNVATEGNLGREEGCKEGPATEPQATALVQEAIAGVKPSGPSQGPVSNVPPKSRSTSKVNSKGSLAGGAGKWKKKGKLRTQGGWMDERPLDASERAAAIRLGFRWYPYYSEAGEARKVIATVERRMGNGSQRVTSAQSNKQGGNSNVAEGEPANETKSKGPKGIPKSSPRMNHPEEKKTEEPPGLGPFYYLGGANGVDILNAFCKNKGWQRIYDNRREDYILKWCETKFRDTYFNFREGEQLLYQIPNNKILTTKIGLLMNLREYERVMRKISRTTKVLIMEDFFPETFRLDTKDEREIFFEIYAEPQIWICKPTSSNQGRGIFLLKNQAEVNDLQARLLSIEEDPLYKKLPYKIPPARIVQRYIDKPLLLEGKKFDVRSYLLIACTAPYMLFFGHGYVRLTCLNYDPKSEDLTSHLTNQYVQKKSPMYSHVKEETVWRMDRFNNYVNERLRHIKGLPKDWVFNGFTKRMKEIMLQCFLAVKSKLECKVGYFDLIGCDFLIDENFKVWLLEMNANPALHTNCSSLKSIIPTVVNETLDLAIEIFTKREKAENILPLESLCHFVLLYNGVTMDNGLSRTTKSRTSLRSLRSHRSLTDNTSFCNNSYNASTGRLAEKPLAKALEKTPKVELSSHSEGITFLPSKGVPRDTLPMPQIQISIVPNVACCPSVKAILRGNQVCRSGNQYIIKHVPAPLDRHPMAESGDDKAKATAGGTAGNPSKDRSYAAWFQQTFGTKFQAAGGNGTAGPLTSSQMVSLHLQSSLPPTLPAFQEFTRPLRQLMTHAKLPAESGKALALSHSCSESLPDEKKVSYRGS